MKVGCNVAGTNRIIIILGIFIILWLRGSGLRLLIKDDSLKLILLEVLDAGGQVIKAVQPNQAAVIRKYTDLMAGDGTVSGATWVQQLACTIAMPYSLHKQHVINIQHIAVRHEEGPYF